MAQGQWISIADPIHWTRTSKCQWYPRNMCRAKTGTIAALFSYVDILLNPPAQNFIIRSTQFNCCSRLLVRCDRYQTTYYLCCSGIIWGQLLSHSLVVEVNEFRQMEIFMLEDIFRSNTTSAFCWDWWSSNTDKFCDLRFSQVTYRYSSPLQLPVKGSYCDI